MDRSAWEEACDWAREYVPKRRYAMAIGLVVGFLAGYPF